MTRIATIVLFVSFANSAFASPSTPPSPSAIDIDVVSMRDIQQAALDAAKQDGIVKTAAPGSQEQVAAQKREETDKTTLVAIADKNPGSATATTFATQALTKLGDYGRAARVGAYSGASPISSMLWNRRRRQSRYDRADRDYHR